MHILIIDRDEASAETLKALLTEQGHDVVHETVRKVAQEKLSSQHFDMVFVDPAPLPSAREITLPIRWEHKEEYSYLVLTGYDIDENEVTRSGMNASLSKPYQPVAIENLMLNARRLQTFMHRLRTGNTSLTDTHIFGQRGFYQLLLSALDRSYRYKERAFLLTIRVTNLETLVTQAGQNAADEILNELGGFLSRLHRLSDFLGHADKNEYVLLILRPALDSEPQDAIERFATALSDFRDRVALRVKPEFGLYLWGLPDGEVMMNREIS